MQLQLIRHGITQGNQEKWYYGALDLPLCPQGREALLALKQAGGYPQTEGHTLYTTGLLRTEETFALLFGDAPHTTRPGFQEMKFGVFEGKSFEMLEHDPAYQAWISGDFEENVPPQGESVRAFAARILAELEALCAQGEDAIVVAHGGTIGVVMTHLFPDAGKSFYDWMPEPGHGYTVTLTGDAPSYTAIPRPTWADKHYAFFQNTACECFPCHKTSAPADFNCLFCYCPLFALGDKCGGNFTYNAKGNKDCTRCTFPHRRENYGAVLEKYPQIAQLARENRDEQK